MELKEAIEKLVDLGAGIPQKALLTVSGSPVAVIPADYKVQDLSDVHTKYAPLRVNKSTEYEDLGSWVDYIARHKTENTCAWADPVTGKFVAAIDWPSADNKPTYTTHWAAFQTKESEQWKLWTSFGTQKTQEAFLEFIEAHGRRVIVPTSVDGGESPAYLVVLQAARELEGRKEVQWKAGSRLKDGQRTLQYAEASRTFASGQAVEIFDFFTIAIPVYYSQMPILIECRFCFRVHSGGLALWWEIYEQDRLKREAFDAFFAQAKAALVDALSVPLYLGRPAAAKG